MSFPKKYWLAPLLTAVIVWGAVATLPNDCVYRPIWVSVGGIMIQMCP